MIRLWIIFDNNMLSFDYIKFRSNIACIHKYFIESNNKYFPTKTFEVIDIQLNEKQTKNIVNAIVNKDFKYKSCNEENNVLCTLYNIRYNDIDMKRNFTITK